MKNRSQVGFGLAFAAALLLAASARAAGYEDLFTPLSQGACVKMDAVRALGATVELTPDQFQFVRAFFMAIPPVSHELPPGDKAFYAKDSEGVAVFGLFGDDGQVCSVFRSTDWLERLVDEVGKGEAGHRDNPT